MGEEGWVKREVLKGRLVFSRAFQSAAQPTLAAWLSNPAEAECFHSGTPTCTIFRVCWRRTRKNRPIWRERVREMTRKCRVEIVTNTPRCKAFGPRLSGKYLNLQARALESTCYPAVYPASTFAQCAWGSLSKTKTILTEELSQSIDSLAAHLNSEVPLAYASFASELPTVPEL